MNNRSLEEKIEKLTVLTVIIGIMGIISNLFSVNLKLPDISWIELIISMILTSAVLALFFWYKKWI